MPPLTVQAPRVHTTDMRWLLVVVVAAGVLAFPVTAASVDPRRFVLNEVDVPRGYLFDENNSLLVTRAQLTRVPEGESRRLVRLGFQAGYYARYRNSDPPRWRYVASGAFVFLKSTGPRAYMPRLIKSEFVKAGVRARRVGLGDEARLYVSSSREEGSSVVWRSGRVLAWVSCSQMTNHEALALAQARKQQRRVARELR